MMLFVPTYPSCPLLLCPDRYRELCGPAVNLVMEPLSWGVKTMHETDPGNKGPATYYIGARLTNRSKTHWHYLRLRRCLLSLASA